MNYFSFNIQTLLKHITFTNTIMSTNTSSNKGSVTTWRPNRQVSQVPKSFENVNSQDINGISVCIRFAFKNITPQRVFACLKKVNIEIDGSMDSVFLGIIERIDEVVRKDGNKMFFVHFSPNSWGKTAGGDTALTQLCDGELRVYYDEPYFWKLSISKSRRPRDERKQVSQPINTPDSELDELFSSCSSGKTKKQTGNERPYEDKGSIVLEVRKEIKSHSDTSGESVEMDDMFA